MANTNTDPGWLLIWKRVRHTLSSFSITATGIYIRVRIIRMPFCIPFLIQVTCTWKKKKLHFSCDIHFFNQTYLCKRRVLLRPCVASFIPGIIFALRQCSVNAAPVQNEHPSMKQKYLSYDPPPTISPFNDNNNS